MLYLESPSTDPAFNLALEQYVFDSLDQSRSWFMLWQNYNAIIVGKHQNTPAEINREYVEEQGIKVIRRLSGGGAVYHDLGNINFTFITGYKENTLLNFSIFCQPLIQALESFGINAELSGRNDMTIDGKKFSGNAQYKKRGRVMHHGTIMYDSDLEKVAKALLPDKTKITSKGLTSVKSRITNVKPYMHEDIPVHDFMAAVKTFMFKHNHMREYSLTPADFAGIQKLRENIYDRWEWNYGYSPAYKIKKKERYEGCGSIELYLDVEKGVITGCSFRGDFFGTEDPDDLAERLRGLPHEKKAITEALTSVNIQKYFFNLPKQSFIALLTD